MDGDAFKVEYAKDFLKNHAKEDQLLSLSMEFVESLQLLAQVTVLTPRHEKSCQEVVLDQCSMMQRGQNACPMQFRQSCMQVPNFKAAMNALRTEHVIIAKCQVEARDMEAVGHGQSQLPCRETS